MFVTATMSGIAIPLQPCLEALGEPDSQGSRGAGRHGHHSQVQPMMIAPWPVAEKYGTHGRLFARWTSRWMLVAGLVLSRAPTQP